MLAVTLWICTKKESGTRQFSKAVLADEYRINSAIANYSKPYVAVMDGIVMGGGVGISAHGSHRIVTERTIFAMPECSIGLIPDVGGSYLLSRSAGFVGEYIGLTGARLSGADCIYAGLADFFVASKDLPSMKAAIVETGNIDVISDFAKVGNPSFLEEHQSQIDQTFGSETVSEIKTRLESDDTNFAKGALKGFNRGAPLALLAAFKTIRMGREVASLEEALRNEYRFVSQAVTEGEFIEGVRAAVIEKDRRPRWKFPNLEDVPNRLIDSLDFPAIYGDFALG